MIEVLSLAAAAVVLTILMTGWMRRQALAHGILDAPNARSSHTQVTPRGGGVAIATVCLLAVVFACWRGSVDPRLAGALVGGGLIVMWIGFEDDRRSISVRARLIVHLIAAGGGVYLLGGLAPLQLGSRVVDLGLAGDGLAVIAIVWAINLFNFMDGIDGIAGSEAAFAGAMGSFLALDAFHSTGVGTAGALMAAACCGFLVWNWPPAKIFMGDAGSGFLGFFIAILAIAETRTSPAGCFVWLILGGAFFADAMVTFLRRLLRGARVSVAHREHAYQWLTRRWGSHRPVVLVMWAINVAWLAPLAWVAATYPELALWAAIVALGPLFVAAYLNGAGRIETPVANG